MNKFKERLRESMKSLNLSQAQLASKVGLSRTTINGYCNGHREPSLDALILISKALGETTDYLLGVGEI